MRMSVFIELPDDGAGERVLYVLNAVRLAMRDSHPDCQVTGYEIEASGRNIDTEKGRDGY